MFLIHDCDGNINVLANPDESPPLRGGKSQDIRRPTADEFIARVERARPEEWQGETGQIGLEFRGQRGQDWLFMSLVGEGRYLLFAQHHRDGRVHAVDPQADGALQRSFVVGGIDRVVADSDLIGAEQAASAVSFFLDCKGHLSPAIHWRKNGKPYWPEYD